MNKPEPENYNKVVDFFRDNIKEVSNYGFINLSQQLTDLMVIFPSKNATQWQWRVFIRELRGVLYSQRNIVHEWQFTDAQLKILSYYFSANSLLLECLNLATVSNRKAIKNSLFLPPANNN